LLWNIAVSLRSVAQLTVVIVSPAENRTTVQNSTGGQVTTGDIDNAAFQSGDPYRMGLIHAASIAQSAIVTSPPAFDCTTMNQHARMLHTDADLALLVAP
jgi:hypothetical protein